ncbi:hypothetical protein CVT24_003045 [Panaeolus cyanescens]|uniref:Uncharacterized protein n=1 Tax=Panaeolus cyanescens TaxID=181874 RepID=A0A409VFR5_9AGAR|nr:hypothetical protein CVT24_003045 [Panaeolus cyanescens]
MSLYASIISSIHDVDAARRAAADRVRQHEESTHHDESQTFDDDIAHEENVVRGYKASLHNPHVSARAKMESENILEQKGVIEETKAKDRKFKKYYSRMHNTNLSPEERYEAEQYLEQNGGLRFVEDEASHQYNINRGYQATLNNPNVSEEARNHARSYLKEHGGL